MKTPAPSLSGLYVITDPHLNDDLIEATRQALEGGARLVQYRNQPADARTRFLQVRELIGLCHDHGARLIVNDETTLAKATGADGVHLESENADAAAARELLGPDKLVGVSCHGSLEQARKAVAAGADHVSFGRFFASHTKPDAEAAAIDILAQAADLGVPLVAIGGITLDNAPQLLTAGADVLAVIHSIFASDDISTTCRQFISLCEEHS